MDGWLPGWKVNFQKHEDSVPEAALHSLIRISFKKSLTMGAGGARRDKNKLCLMPILPAAALAVGIALQACTPDTHSRVTQTVKQREAWYAETQIH